MKPTLFQRGWVPRVAAGVAYGLAAFGAVAALEASRPARAAAPAAGASAPHVRATVCIESILPVERWEVRLDGHAITAARTTSTLWLGEMEASAGSTLVVDAEPPAGGRREPNSLRIRVAGTTPARDHTAWCTREWTLATALDRLARAPAPIDPEDLP